MSTKSTRSDCAIVALATGWNTSHGGVNAFNADFCRAIAGILRMRFFCVVISALPQEIAEARNHDVHLIPLGLPVNSDHLTADCANLIVECVGARCNLDSVAWWIGHDIVTGEAAAACRRITGRGRLLAFQHAAYQSYEVFKRGDGEAALRKDHTQSRILEAADIVAAVGPKLAGYARATTRTNKYGPVVLQFVPGLPEVRPRSAPGNFRAVTFGRIGGASDVIKQTRLAVAGFASAVKLHSSNIGQDPNMTVIGLPADQYQTIADELAQLAYRHGGRLIAINSIPYSIDRSRLLEIVSEHTASLMLSIHEGFGLSGWEAVGAGVPLVVTKNSGLYELIDEALGGRGTGCLFPVDVRGAPGPDEVNVEDLASVVAALGEIAYDPEKARRDALYLRSELVRLFPWGRAARAIAKACDMRMKSEPIQIGLAGGFPDVTVLGEMSVDGNVSAPQLNAREIWYAAVERLGRRFAEISDPGVALRFSGVDGGNFSALIVRQYASAAGTDANITTYTHQQYDNDESAYRQLLADFPAYFSQSNIDDAAPYMTWIGDVIVGPSIEGRRELLVDGSHLVLCAAGSAAVGQLIDEALERRIPILALSAFGGESARRCGEIVAHNERLNIPRDMKTALFALATAQLDKAQLLERIDCVVDAVKSHLGARHA